MNKIKNCFLLLLAIAATSCQLSRFFVYNLADIRDYKKFPSRALSSSTDTTLFDYKVLPSQKFAASALGYQKEKHIPAESFLKKHNTVAFLIIKNDTILYEKYFRGRDSSSWTPSFSVAKSFTSALIGCAINDGYIHSVKDTVTTYLPELKKNGFDKVTIEHLLQMTSGIRFKENYFSPFEKAAGYYYGRNLKKKMTRLKLKRKPGTKFEYSSGNTQLLGWVLERALKNKTLTQYLQEKIWQPCGMESNGSWSIDQEKKGIEKTFCCLNASARDFSRFGRLYLNNGSWQGKEIISQEWVKNSIVADTANGGSMYYKYQWWLEGRNSNNYSAQGYLGQYIYVCPEKKIVIVRLGKNEGGVYWPMIFKRICRDL